MLVMLLVVLTVGVFMAGCAFGAREARLDYEPLIERLLKAQARFSGAPPEAE